MEKVRAIYGRNNLPFSIVIRMFTHSQWSHCGLVSEDGKRVYESTFLHGVQCVPIEEFYKRYKKTFLGELFCVSAKEAYQIAESHIGEKYDVLGLVGIVFRTGWNSASRWICSEYLARCSQLFRSDKESIVSPEDMYRLTHKLPKIPG